MSGLLTTTLPALNKEMDWETRPVLRSFLRKYCFFFHKSELSILKHFSSKTLPAPNIFYKKKKNINEQCIC